jgi:signal transduction histidine kinase/CheY-like chemotaxis protein
MHKRTFRQAYALWKGEERYRVLFDSIDEGFCVIEVLFDASGAPYDYRFLETNPAFEKQTGVTNPVGRCMRELEPRHEARWFEIYGRVARTGEPQRFVQEARYPENRWFDVYAFRVGRPEECKVAALFTDISQRKRAEDAVRQSEERFRAFVTASSEVVYRMSADWRDVLALEGPDLDRATARPQAAWLQQSYVEPEDRPLVKAAIDEASRTKGILQLEHRVRRDDGTLGWMLSCAVPILGDDGGIKEWFCTASDITARKEAEQTLHQTDRAKDEFLAVLGHELRNPLAALSTALELLERARAKPELVDSVRPMMRRQLAHLQRLVDDLLDVSRLSCGRAVLQNTPLDLRTAVAAAIEQCWPLIHERGHDLAANLARERVPIRGDSQRLTQVIGNLLTNAAKYSADGGKITLTCASEASEAVIRIADTGFGIPPHRLEMLFVMFNQVPEHATLGGTGGLGIGLALARRLVELHGGSIEATSAGLGAGSEFIVRLPLALEPAAHGTGSETRPESEWRASQIARRVLIVDDNVDAADSLRLMLEIRGHDVRATYDGSSALETLQEFDAEVVLLDLGMPRMDGLEVARRIRALPLRATPRLIALTGWGQPEDKHRTSEAGFDAHLTKPADALALAELIEG